MKLRQKLQDRKVRKQMRRDCPEFSTLLEAVASTKKGKA